MDIPTTEPTQITAGDSLSWVRSLTGYPAGLGWVLHYVLLSQGKTPISFASTPAGDDHQVDLAAATTATWGAASYRWTAFVTNGTQRVTLASGAIQVLPDPTQATAATDPRSENQIILDAITAVLAGELTNPLAKYRINGREAERYSRMELLKLQTIYKHRVAVETGQADPIPTTMITFAGDFGIPFGGYGGRF
jgi:hypothetical protein